jgi:2-haloacid dehalogenase
MMARVIVFDVNETLLELKDLRPYFEHLFGNQAVIEQWFALLLHSSLVSTLGDDYHDFGSLAGAALDVLAKRHAVTLGESDLHAIVDGMKQLPPHPDVRDSLERLRSAGFRLATLTNSSRSMVGAQMDNAALSEYFDLQLSVDEVRRFKPAPEVYQMAASRLGVPIDQVRLLAAHDWDVFGALRAGCAGAFVARGGRSYHPLYQAPDIAGPDMHVVTDQILTLDTP